MHMVLMAANASGIMQETKVGKEMILIVIKAWDMHSRVGIQNLKDVLPKTIMLRSVEISWFAVNTPRM